MKALLASRMNMALKYRNSYRYIIIYTQYVVHTMFPRVPCVGKEFPGADLMMLKYKYKYG